METPMPKAGQIVLINLNMGTARVKCLGQEGGMLLGRIIEKEPPDELAGPGDDVPFVPDDIIDILE